MIAHLLHGSGKSFNLLLLTRDHRSLLLHFSVVLYGSLMLFQKLVEQHRVHCFVANRVNLALAKCRTGLTIACLETELYDATSPEETTRVDFLIHKPGIGCI